MDAALYPLLLLPNEGKAIKDSAAGDACLVQEGVREFVADLHAMLDEDLPETSIKKNVPKSHELLLGRADVKHYRDTIGGPINRVSPTLWMEER